ncbi:hypothetical protein Tco_0088060 [Tanacetum coccineum]
MGGTPNFSSSDSSSASSFDSQNDSYDDTSETGSDELFNFLSGRDLDWQLSKETEEGWPIPLKISKVTFHFHPQVLQMGKGDDEIKVLAEINVELQSGTDKLIKKLSQEKDNDDASISGKSSDFFGWDGLEMDSLDTEDVVVPNNVPQEVAGEVVFNPVVYEEVAEEDVEMANDHDKAIFDQ